MPHVERDSLDRATARLQAEQASALDAIASEANRDLTAAKEVSERERREAASRLSEDQEHRARVNQADLRRLEQHTSDMRALLVAEREQWAQRERPLRVRLPAAPFGAASVFARWPGAGRVSHVAASATA